MASLRCSMGSGPVQPNLQGTFDFVESDQAQYNLLLKNILCQRGLDPVQMENRKILMLNEIRPNTTCK